MLEQREEKLGAGLSLAGKMHDTVFVGAFLQELSKAPVGTRTSTWWKGNNPTSEKKTKENQRKARKENQTRGN